VRHVGHSRTSPWCWPPRRPIWRAGRRGRSALRPNLSRQGWPGGVPLAPVHAAAREALEHDREVGLPVPDGSAPPGLTDDGALAALVCVASPSSRRRRFFLDRACSMEDSLSPCPESTVLSASGNAMLR
jgi:hypothetical protein